MDSMNDGPNSKLGIASKDLRSNVAQMGAFGAVVTVMLILVLATIWFAYRLQRDNQEMARNSNAALEKLAIDIERNTAALNRLTDNIWNWRGKVIDTHMQGTEVGPEPKSKEGG